MSDKDLATDVKIIQNDLNSFQNILDRFDTTINKLTDVSNTLNKLIAVQESRIDTQEKSIEIVHRRISDMKEELHEEMAGHYQTVLDELKEMKEAQQVLSNLSENSATGPDRVPARMLKRFAAELAVFL